jgi:hypothetical protein
MFLVSYTIFRSGPANGVGDQVPVPAVDISGHTCWRIPLLAGVEEYQPGSAMERQCRKCPSIPDEEVIVIG